MLELDLQYFAKEGPGGEKTEEATSKKLQDARKEGQVAKSKEVSNAFTLLAFFLLLKITIGNIGNSLGDLFGHFYNRIPDLIVGTGDQVPFQNLEYLIKAGMTRLLLILLPIFLIGFSVAFISNVVQVGWSPTGKPLQPKLSKINPMKGFKRIFSSQSLAELIKSIMKVGLIAIVAYNYLKGKLGSFFILLDMPVTQAVGLIGELVINLGLMISILYMLIAATDFIYQKRKFKNDMKMTKQEVKDEYKDQEGDPQIKGKQRQRMQEASRRRMMQALPQADVVITNPTHYAVAIKYDADIAPAPVLLAKGSDYLAVKIKETAKEYGIEIVENKPLARMIYANVEVGAQIPPELYQAVAEILAYVYHLQGSTGKSAKRA